MVSTEAKEGTAVSHLWIWSLVWRIRPLPPDTWSAQIWKEEAEQLPFNQSSLVSFYTDVNKQKKTIFLFIL